MKYLVETLPDGMTVFHPDLPNLAAAFRTFTVEAPNEEWIHQKFAEAKAAGVANVAGRWITRVRPAEGHAITKGKT